MSDLRQRNTPHVGTATSAAAVDTLPKDKSAHAEKHRLRAIAEAKRFAASSKLDALQMTLALVFNAVVFVLPMLGFDAARMFYSLQYQYPNSTAYDVGVHDSFFVVFWVINLSFLRCLLITFVFKPMARMLNITDFKATQRFIEQWWSVIYYSVSWSCGMVLYHKSSYFFNCYNLFAGWPHDQLSGFMKTYYLIQTASWFQQFIVLHLEARRKDHYQMLSHHIVTILLCTGSYRFYFTRIGHIILLMMDIVDVTLSFAKILKYSGFQTLCDVMFIVFMGVWIVSRHGFYNYVLYYTFRYARSIMNMNCNTIAGAAAKMCYTDVQIDGFLALLAALQVIMCVWMYMILKVAIRVVTGGDADDIRSDSD